MPLQSQPNPFEITGQNDEEFAHTDMSRQVQILLVLTVNP